MVILGVLVFCCHGVLNLLPFQGVSILARAMQVLPTSMWASAHPRLMPFCPWPKSRSFFHTLAAACRSWPFGVAVLGSPPPSQPRQLSQCFGKHPAVLPSPCLSFPSPYSASLWVPAGAPTWGGTHRAVVYGAAP